MIFKKIYLIVKIYLYFDSNISKIYIYIFNEMNGVNYNYKIAIHYIHINVYISFIDSTETSYNNDNYRKNFNSFFNNYLTQTNH